MTQDITSLIEKLERAESGSRELDCVIYEIQNPSHAAVKGQVGRYYDPNVISALGAEKYITRGTYVVPKYTTSLDAALALAERVLPGDPDFSPTGPSVGWKINLYRGMVPTPLGGWIVNLRRHATDGFEGQATTAALALCAALLRAQSEAR